MAGETINLGISGSRAGFFFFRGEILGRDLSQFNSYKVSIIILFSISGPLAFLIKPSLGSHHRLNSNLRLIVFN